MNAYTGNAMETAGTTRPSNAGEVARNMSEPLERGLANEPANSTIRTMCLAGAGIAVAASLMMQLRGNKHEALFFGQWAPTLIAFALWYQIVKSTR
jgi:hypothetical protein